MNTMNTGLMQSYLVTPTQTLYHTCFGIALLFDLPLPGTTVSPGIIPTQTRFITRDFWILVLRTTGIKFVWSQNVEIPQIHSE